ncbi:hypothetical protein TRFO_29302 [Tritrichomonas foetus]|uniref:Tetraspanin family protein n=1 Tax=Tritrichomonas foetus TaxID=1144522 RepID=A0A1J4K0P7_9EUKA|nr:hypothetical protein TRFO_29302 [Tritrichomonas foetus]|eukprot:OHT03324.1 hypothetical protein TRFO_29302 [Tritrichomonas foetus]
MCTSLNRFWIFRCVFLTIGVVLTSFVAGSFFLAFFAIFIAETYGSVAVSITAPCFMLAFMFFVIGCISIILSFVRYFWAHIYLVVYFSLYFIFYLVFCIIFAGTGEIAVNLIGKTFNNDKYAGWRLHFEEELKCCAYYVGDPPERCRIDAARGFPSCKSIIIEKYNSNYRYPFTSSSAILCIFSIACLIVCIAGIYLGMKRKKKIHADDEEDDNRKVVVVFPKNRPFYAAHWEETSSGDPTFKKSTKNKDKQKPVLSDTIDTFSSDDYSDTLSSTFINQNNTNINNKNNTNIRNKNNQNRTLSESEKAESSSVQQIIHNERYSDSFGNSEQESSEHQQTKVATESLSPTPPPSPPSTPPQPPVQRQKTKPKMNPVSPNSKKTSMKGKNVEEPKATPGNNFRKKTRR